MAMVATSESPFWNSRSGTRRDDVLDGTDGRDRLYGGWGADVLRGGRGDDRLFGEGGNDRLEGGEGDDLLDGGLGTDLASFANSAAAVRVDLRAGRATGQGADRLNSIEDVEGSAHADVLGGDSRANRLSGGGGDDALWGGRGDDALDGGEGDDALHGGIGDDRLDGGLGRDTAGYADASYAISLVSDAGGLVTVVGGAGEDRLAGIEVVEGTRFGDAMAGHATLADAAGQPVDQTFRGMAGDDDLAGGAGSDVLEGGTGDDVLAGDYGGLADGGNDRLDGGDGRDRLLLDKVGRDLHAGGAGADVFELYDTGGSRLSGADLIADFAAGEDVLSFLVRDDAGGVLDGDELLDLLDWSGDGRLDAADAGASARGWSLSVDDVTLGDATASSLLIEAGPGASADGYVLCLFGVTELGGADLI